MIASLGLPSLGLAALAQDPSPAEGFELLLAARVIEPRAIEFSVDGRLWVVDGSDGGWLRVFEDTDGDAHFEEVPAEAIQRDATALAIHYGEPFVATDAGLFVLDAETHEVRRCLPLLDDVASLRRSLSGAVVAHSPRGDGLVPHLAQPEFDLPTSPMASARGGCRDDFGRWFGCGPGALAWHFPFEHEDRAWLLPALAEPRMRVALLPDDTDGAARGPCIYRATALGDELHGDLIVCDPEGGRVRRIELEESGFTFVAHPRPDIVGPSAGFEPVQARTGPDGALWIVDRAGAIWRVVPSGDRLVKSWDLLALDEPARVALLTSDSGALRELLKQWLYSEAALLEVAASTLDRTQPPAARLFALEVLGDCRRVRDRDVVEAFHEDSHALLAAAGAPLRPFDPALRDPDPRVVAAELRALVETWTDPARRKSRMPDRGLLMKLGTLLVEPDLDEHLRIFVASAAAHHPSECLHTALYRLDERAPPELIRALLEVALADLGGEMLGRVLDRVIHHPSTDATRRRELLAVFVRSMDGAGRSLEALESEGRPYLQMALRSMQPTLRAARGVALDQQASPAERATAVTLLMRIEAERDEDARALHTLLDPAQPETLRAVAVAAFARDSLAQTTDVLLARWLDLEDELHAQALSVVLAHDDRARALLHHARRDLAILQSLDGADRERLLTHETADIAAAALELFGE